MKQGANDVAKMLLRKKIQAALIASAPFVLGILGFVFIILMIVSPIAAAKEASTQAGEGASKFFERLGGFFSGNGWNTSEEAYFKLLADEKLGCKNSKIVTATIMYYYQVSPDATIENGNMPLEEEADENVTLDESGDNMYDGIPYGQLLPDLKRLIKKIRKGMDVYEEYVKDTFLEQKPYNELLSGTSSSSREKLKDKIYEEMLSISETIECPYISSFGYYGINCPGVVVTGNYAGTYSLDEYVAGVVKAENGGAPAENLKVQAILARTYVLKQTNNCTTSIENSISKQVFIPTEEEIYVNAANETAGNVLVMNNELISTYFASYPQAGYNTGGSAFPSFPACDAVTCNDSSCTTTFYKMPNAEPFSLSTNIKNPSGNYWNGVHLQNQTGHCYGYSQVAGRDLELNQNMNYTQIIQTFHSDGVQISSSLAAGPGLLAADSTGFLRRVSWPNESSDSDVNFWFSNNNLSYQGGYVGQCTWYAFGRANEILSLAGSNYKWKHAPDAGQWYKYNLNDGENGFKSSININEPKVGSIMVLNGKGAGHVMIVEAVYEDGDIAVSEGNIRVNNPNPYGFRYIEKINPSDYVAQFKKNGYSFGGYIYLLD